MNNGEIPAPYQDPSMQTQYPSGADSWLGRESGLPRPSFPNVGRIPKTPFEIDVRVTSKDGKPYTYYEGDFRPHAFYGKRTEEGVLIYPGLLITYIEGSQGGTAVQEVWQPDGLTTAPLLVSAGAGDIICLKFDITSSGSGYIVENVLVEVGAPGLTSAEAGGTASVEIGTVTSNGFNQKLRSDFFYTSIYSNDAP